MSDNRHLEDTHEVAVEAWRVAEERAAELRAAWREAGSPATTVGGSNGRSLVAHPLLEAVERAGGERAARMLSRSCSVVESSRWRASGRRSPVSGR
jgi:hypothetical protein